MMTISGWMCFEVLAVDLWKTLVNEFPIPLARKVLSGQPAPDTDGLQRDQKSLSLSVLDRFGFDLSKKMGDVLANQRKVNLDSFVGILSAYKTSFGPDFSEDFPNELRWLEAYRNLYAHRGGIVDSTFIRRVKGMGTEEPLQIGQNFQITGYQTRDFMNVVVRAGLNLLRFADRWINEQTRGAGFQEPLIFH